jgi:hypothetical protein
MSENPAATDGARSRRVLGRMWRGAKFVMGGPVAAFGPEEVAQGARLIRRLVGDLRRRPAGQMPMVQEDGRTIDLDATARSHAITMEELEERLARRRRETARLAYVTFGLGWLVFGIWICRAVFTVWSSSAIVAAIEFAPFCCAFFVMSFRAALENYQIRTRRLATAIEYLGTSDSFWPS